MKYQPGADRLRSVDVEQHVPLPADGAECFDVLNHAGFIVDVHDRNELRVRSYRRSQFCRVEHAVLVGAEPGDLEPLLRQDLEDVGDRFVLGGHRNQVPAAVRAVTCGAHNGEVVGFRRSGRPHQFRRRASQ